VEERNPDQLSCAVMSAERRSPILRPFLALCLGLMAAAPLGTATRTFRIDPARSRASIAVGKAGAFSFAGHTHEVAIPAVAGTLTLHQIARPIRVPVHADLDADTLTASGRFQVKQTDHGIKPVSVGGVVNVKDALDISFTIVARAAR